VQKPTGGIKVIYQHCILLQELGFEAYPVSMGKNDGNVFGFNVEVKHFDDIKPYISETDVIVATEFAPYDGLIENKSLKIIFVQNWWGVDHRRKKDDLSKSYIDMGYDYVLTCGQYCSEYIQDKMSVPVTIIPNGIDLSKFCRKDSSRKPNTILAMSRKNPGDLAKISSLLERSDYSLRVVDGLSQEELIKEYQSADIFIALGYPEGFSLPPLEAMRCGCVVIGFTGGAAGEFMLDRETALVSNDGDCEGVIHSLNLLSEDETLKERIRENGYIKASEYSLDNTKEHLELFYSNIFKNKKK
tara:strand:- start:30896 stop:31798 length:903 start_codon:yes stop_codon:yes gene_type:complete